MVQESRVIALRFTLKDEAGAVLDSSGGAALSVLLGAGQLVPGLERALVDRPVGARFDVVVPPADGFGVSIEAPLIDVPREAFPAEIVLEPGMPLALEADDGTPTSVWITQLSANRVVLDRNHPLAGRTLHFAVEVVDAREATPAERRAGQALGAAS